MASPSFVHALIRFAWRCWPWGCCTVMFQPPSVSSAYIQLESAHNDIFICFYRAPRPRWCFSCSRVSQTGSKWQCIPSAPSPVSENPPAVTSPQPAASNASSAAPAPSLPGPAPSTPSIGGKAAKSSNGQVRVELSGGNFPLRQRQLLQLQD